MPRVQCIQACVRRAAASQDLRRVRAAAELLRAYVRRASELLRKAAALLQAFARRKEVEAHRYRLLSAQHEKVAFRKQCKEEKECITLLEASACSGSISALRSSLAQAEALGLYHSGAAIMARQALSLLTRNRTTVKGATRQLEHALEKALFENSVTSVPCSDIAVLCGHGHTRGGSREGNFGREQDDSGDLVNEALERCKKAGMSIPQIQRSCLPLFERVVREAKDRSLSALDLVEIRSSILSSMQGSQVMEERAERTFHNELLQPKGLIPKLFYQTRRRSKHLIRLRSMLDIADHVLDIGGANIAVGAEVDYCLREARTSLQDLLSEVHSLYVVSSVELYEARQKERKMTRQRQQRQIVAQTDTSPMLPAIKSSLDLEGDGGDWNLAVLPMIKAFAMRRGFLKNSRKAHFHYSQEQEQAEQVHVEDKTRQPASRDAGGGDQETAIREILTQWPPASKKPSKHFDAADGLSYQLTFSEEERQRTCRKGEGLLYLRRQDCKVTSVEVSFLVANTWEPEQHISLSSVSSALQWLKDQNLIGHEIKCAEGRIDKLEARACAQHRQVHDPGHTLSSLRQCRHGLLLRMRSHICYNSAPCMRDRALHELDTAISSGQLQRLQRPLQFHLCSDTAGLRQLCRREVH